MSSSYYLASTGRRIYLTQEEEAEQDRLRARGEAMTLRQNEETKAFNEEAMAFRNRVLARGESEDDE